MAEKLVETIVVPKEVQVELKGNDFRVKGFGKESARHFKSTGIFMKKTDSGIEVYAKNERRNIVAEAKTVASHIKNSIIGLEKEFEYKLEVVYSHFPMNITVKGNFVEINNLAGAKHPRKSKIVGDTKVEIKGKEITVRGNNKENVGQTVANMEQATKIRGKDVRVFQDGIYITSKAKIV